MDPRLRSGPLSVSPRIQVAIHEAGHAVVAHARGVPVDIVTLSAREPGSKFPAFTRYNPSYTATTALDCALIAMAGVEAERVAVRQYNPFVADSIFPPPHDKATAMHFLKEAGVPLHEGESQVRAIVEAKLSLVLTVADALDRCTALDAASFLKLLEAPLSPSEVSAVIDRLRMARLQMK